MSLARKAGRSLAAFAALLLMGATASAADIVVILDGSGSSAGQIGGVAKIDIARAALQSALLEAPPNLSIGLVAYGHRSDEACDDVEVVADLGTPDTFADAAAGIRSLGRSPIAAAAEAAAGLLANSDGPATIILITDNADNCEPDPCDVVARIAGAQPDLTISVLGIAVPDEEVADLACFAELTGGVFLRADDAASFSANLDEVMRVALGPPPAPPPAATIAFPFGVVQGNRFTVDFIGPAAPGDAIRIAWLGSPENRFISAAMVPVGGDAVQMTAPRELGAFELRYYHAERDTILARMPLPIAAIAPVIEAPETAMAGADIAVRWQVDGQGGETIEIAQPGEEVGNAAVVEEAVRTASMMSITVPTEPGRYEVRLVAPPPSTDEPPEIRGGQLSRILAVTEIEITDAEVAFAFAEPVGAGGDLAIRWTGPGARLDEVRLAVPGEPQNSAIATASAADGTAIFAVPPEPGTYEFRYWSEAFGAVIGTQRFDSIAVDANLSVPQSVAGGGVLAVIWAGPGVTGDEIVLFGPDGGQIERVRVPLFEEPVVIDAPVEPGEYVIAYVARGGGQLAEATFTIVAPSVQLTVGAEVDAGESFEIEWRGPGGRFDEIRLVGPGASATIVAARRIDEAGTLSLRAPEEPGRYTVQYWSGAIRASLAAESIDVRCVECDDAIPLQPPALRLDP